MIGIDIIEVSRIESGIKEYGDILTDRIFTASEIEYCFSFNNPYERFAGKFAAKEAVFKALKLEGSSSLLREIEIQNDSVGAPSVRFGDSLKDYRDLVVNISISHTEAQAVSVAMIGTANKVFSNPKMIMKQ